MINSTFLFIALAGQVLLIGVILLVMRRNGAASPVPIPDTTVSVRLEGMSQTMDAHFRAMTVQTEHQRQALDAMRQEHEQRLEAMRQTVDEKLTQTLNSRITESFATVSERLEAVHRGLGDMQQLATGVGDLKKVMTNVRIRGTWGEYQLGALLEQFLTEQQFVRNFKPRADSGEVVEFAIRFPGRNGDGTPIYLPVDSKFPHEDFVRLVEASEAGDPDWVHAARTALVQAVKKSAKDISEKYLMPPVTTDFGVLFLPTESLYAEVVREGGLIEELQQKYRIHLAGPTTLGALLTSFRVGFQSIVIEQRAGEIAMLLGVAKREFGKFNEVLNRAERQINTVARSLQEGRRRTHAVERKLKDVETPDVMIADQLLGMHDEAPTEIEGDLDEEITT